MRVSDYVKKGLECSPELVKLYRLTTKLSRKVTASHRCD